MSRISNILVKVRDSLVDHDKQRWSDERLLRLVDEAQKDIAVHTKLLKASTQITVLPDTYTYDLPDDLWLIQRAAYKNCKIDMVSYDSMDEYGRKQVLSDSNRQQGSHSTTGYRSIDYSSPDACWQTDTGGEITAIVFDNRNLNSIRLYPIPTDAVARDRYTFENPEAEVLTFVGANAAGVVTDIDNYTFNSDYGAVDTLFEPGVTERYIGEFGVVTDMTESDSILTIWYIKRAADITTTDDTLELHSTFDAAMRYYVLSHAFADDNDAGFIEKGAMYMNLYNRELEVITETSTKDGVQNNTSFETTYRGPFE